MKKEIIYNKLVRDNILEIILCNNQKSSYHIATDEEYKNKLLEKLQEEISEFIIDKNEEELADIFEVIEHIITAFNFNKFFRKYSFIKIFICSKKPLSLMI